MSKERASHLGLEVCADVYKVKSTETAFQVNETAHANKLTHEEIICIKNNNNNND